MAVFDSIVYSNEGDEQQVTFCPYDRVGGFVIGLDRWASLHTIMQTFPVIGDLGGWELLGFSIPLVGLGVVGYSLLSGLSSDEKKGKR